MEEDRKVWLPVRAIQAKQVEVYTEQHSNLGIARNQEHVGFDERFLMFLINVGFVHVVD
jgi:hypothetical protein